MALHFDLQPPPPKPHWGRALRDAQALVNDGDRTELAFRVQRAVDPDVHARMLHQMLAHPEGRRLVRERPSLRDALCDRAELERLPAGSLGRAYLAHLDRHGLEAAKLIDLGEREETIATDPDVRWMAERSRLTHDLWHVVSGYSAEGQGEAALLCFSFAQFGGHSTLVLSVLANLQLARTEGLAPLGRAIRAWRRGHAAVCLGALPWEELLAEPLHEVRAAAGITPLLPRDGV